MFNKSKKEIKPKEENFQKTLNYCLFLLNRRDHSQKEIKDKLIHYQYHPNDIEKVLNYLVENKFQSDQRFAEIFIKTKLNKFGKKRIFQELKSKGIDEDLIKHLLEESFEDNLNSLQAENILLKKFKNIEELKQDKEKWFKKDKPKIIRFMFSRGFDFNDFNHLL